MADERSKPPIRPWTAVLSEGMKVTRETPDREILSVIGIGRFGSRWKRDLAAALEVSPTLIYAIDDGSRIMTEQMRERVALWCRSELLRLGKIYAYQVAACHGTSDVLFEKIATGVPLDEPLKPSKPRKKKGSTDE